MNESNELEQVLIGAMLLEKKTITELSAILLPEMFSSPNESKIASVIFEMHQNEKPIDLVTVSQEMREKKLFDDKLTPFYVTSLTAKIDSAENASYYAYKLKESYLIKKIGDLGSALTMDAIQPSADAFGIIDKLQNQIQSLNEIMTMGTHKPIDNLSKRALAALRDQKQVINTGIDSLDRDFVGFDKSDLWFLAARPGMGKTAVALNIMSYNVLRGVNTKFFSFEMSDVQLMHRCYSDLASVPYSTINNRAVNDDQYLIIESKATKYVRDNVEIIDTGIRSVDQIVSKCRADHMRKEIDLIIIDYLQIIPIQSKLSRNDQIGYITGKLKQLAKDCHCPVICLSQLNRAVESRPDKRPQLSDLRDSGNIEQDADGVIFLYRPEYYGINEDENGNPTIGTALADFAKYRAGTVREIWMSAELDYMRFS